MPQTALQTAAPLTITQVAQLLNQSLERAFPEMLFEGEISQLIVATSGHMYFALKDENSQISAVMWRGSAATLGFKPEPGMTVACAARPNFYHKTGKLQMVVHRMTQAGAGALQKKFLELKAKLEREGLFAETRKRKLPYFPKALGVVTSATGAVIHDIMIRLKERMPSLPVYLVDVRVQGEGAAEEIAQGIELLNRSGFVDVMIVGRGGGSLEDLWAFNEERVVRAIFASNVPVISAVGHERDNSLSDLVADLRAPTPTAAAEMVVPHRDDLLQRIGELERRLTDTDRWFEPLVQMFDELVLRLGSRVQSVVDQAAVQVSRASALVQAIEPGGMLARLSERVEALRNKLSVAFPVEKITGYQQRVEQSLSRLDRAAERQIGTATQQIMAASQRLEALSPRKVLERGYSIVEHQGVIVRRSDELQLQDRITVTLYKGKLEAEISKKT